MLVAAPAEVTGGILVPSGRSLPLEAWRRRHRGVIAILAAHAVGLPAFGVLVGANPAHALFEGAILAVVALVAALPSLGRRARSVAAAFGLMSSSAILTHLSGGYIEAHFHFFVMLGVIFLYEDWLPYVLAVGYVAVHHGVAGTLDPLSVYNHPDAIAHPWQWAGIHALFILGLSAALLVAWNVIEHARLSETRALREAQDLKRQLHSHEKMAALGSLVAGLAHEVRTPLTVVGTSASLLEIWAKDANDRVFAERVLAQAAEIHANVDRMNALVLQLRRFHGLAPDGMSVARLDAVVKDAVTLFASANKSGRVVHAQLQPTSGARLDPLGVHQVVLNLVSNAVEATDAATARIVVRTREEHGFAVLVVEDNGTGMTREAQARAFDPLFTTKKDGMGLGLHIVKRIVEAHGGEVSFESSAGVGTSFVVRFPIERPIASTGVPASRRSGTASATA